jgi:hypothetical protein
MGRPPDDEAKMKRLTFVAAALTIAACADEKDPAQQYRDALPKSAAVQIGVPKGEGVAGAVGAGVVAGDRSSALGQTPSYGSEYASMSYWTAATVNLGVWWTLELVKFITAFPPSACDDASCTWGPWLGDNGLNYYKLHVTKVAGAFDWTLSGQSAAAGTQPWADLIAGHAVPGRDRDHGSGAFDAYYDHFDFLQHATTSWKQDYGTLAVSYDNNAGLFVHAEVVGAHNDDPERLENLMNAAYQFDQTGTDGDLQIAFRDVTVGDQVTLHTRWKRHDGAGRGDVHYLPSGGSGVDASECWNGQDATIPWAEVYDTKIAFGLEANCVFTPAAYATIQLPQ